MECQPRVLKVPQMTLFLMCLVFSVGLREVHRCLVLIPGHPSICFPKKLALLISVKTLEIPFISHTIHVHLPTFNLNDLYGKW